MYWSPKLKQFMNMIAMGKKERKKKKEKKKKLKSAFCKEVRNVVNSELSG